MKKVLSILVCLAVAMGSAFADEVSIEESENILPVEVAEVPETEEVEPELETEELVSEVTESEATVEEPEISEYELKVLEYRAAVQANSASMLKENESEKIIAQIEAKKEEILDIRANINNLASIYNQEVDEKTEAAVSEIMEAPVAIEENDGNGGLSDSAANRRRAKCDEIVAAAEEDKLIFLNELRATVGANEKKALSDLSTLYRSLESVKYTNSSFADNFKIAIGEFNANSGTWPVTFTAKMYGFDDLFKVTVHVSYAEISGNKFIPLDKLTDEEFLAFHDSLEFYSAAIREVPQIFCGKVTFQVYRWKQASEYRIVPERFELTLLGKKNKSLTKISDGLIPRIFVMRPATEVRSESEIAVDAVKANKIISQEAKAKETEADKLVKEYSSSYEYSKKSVNREPTIQKGRGAFMLTTGLYFANEDFANFDTKMLVPELVGFDINFPYGKFAFWGINTGLYLPISEGNLNSELGLNLGFNFKITNYIRPYVQASGNIDSLYNGILKLGGGCDFMLGKLLMLNFNYAYRWAYSFNNQLNPAVDRTTLTKEELDSIPCTSSHKMSIGFGIGW